MVGFQHRSTGRFALLVLVLSLALAGGAAAQTDVTTSRISGTVSDAVYAGSALRVHVALPSGHRLVANVPSGTGVANGAPVRLAWPVAHGRCVRD